MLAGAGLGKPSSPPGAIPQPETRARVISWKPKWHGDRISKAQINWLPRIVGLGVGGTGRLGRYQCPLAKPPPPTNSRDRTQAARSKTQGRLTSSQPRDRRCHTSWAQEKKGPLLSTPAKCCFTPAQPAVRPGPRLRCAGPTVAQAGEPGPRCSVTGHPFPYAGLRPPHPSPTSQ